MNLEGPAVKKVENLQLGGKRVRIDIPTDTWQTLCEMAEAEHRPPAWQLEVVIIEALDRWKNGSGLGGIKDASGLGDVLDEKKGQWRPFVMTQEEMERNDELIEVAEEEG